ncbi:MAG TPA: hypothetical protein VMT15_19695 [Bryobacteraceae bacterium]|nr:hypothetical protein [Bryobacteraceae bacterium]
MPRLFLTCLIAAAAAGQDQPGGGQAGNTPKDPSHILGVVPSHLVTNNKDAPPLTPSGKFRLFVASTSDPFNLLGVGFEAGINQAQNNLPSYGQGSEGYAKRLGVALSDFSIANFFTSYAYPCVLREDPRYFRDGSGSIKKRLGHALASAFVTHTDAGGSRFNYSNVLGSITAGAISNAYYPSSDRGVGLVFSRAGGAMLFGALGAVVAEFGPDLGKKLSGKPNQKAPQDLKGHEVDARGVVLGH